MPHDFGHCQHKAGFSLVEYLETNDGVGIGNSVASCDIMKTLCSL